MRRIQLPFRCLRLMAVLGGGLAAAEEPAGTVEGAREEPPRNYGNLRAGASTSGRRPSICLELSPLARLGLEACGTGSGFLHHDPEPTLTHFRANLTLTSWKTRLGWLQPRLSAGFAELQVGEDGAGFDFSDTGPTGVETAGPELGASVRALFPLSSRLELVGELGVSAAYFRAAPSLIKPQNRFQPSASFTLGVGF
ncbi:hypothetical protein SAMN05444354_102341 [Stigmatella aurantiaca]|uniref:Outer membrane protein beta-barrel domain-containing protein n=1 Tax=Stigmatella aurantiaca TaxID=41 RepID=A0A1H7JV99_STIAU|nr:hypothetical protein [Stigmatella aurantiaca]SEK78651.1 hypothetical protein SAMN05444354_102341 [Stigmatella aurantiaca]